MFYLKIKKNKRQVIVLFLVLLLIFIGFRMSTYLSCCIELPSNQYPIWDGTNIPVPDIYGQTQIGQNFIAERNYLNQIDIFFATHARKNTQDVIFHLRSGVKSNNDLFVTTFKSAHIEDNKFFSIRFPAIPDSKGKEYYFYIESPSSFEGNAVTIWYLPNSTYLKGELYINGVVSKGDLMFRPYYKSNISEYLTILLGRLQTNKPWFYNKYSFVSLFSIYFVSLILAAYLFIRLI